MADMSARMGTVQVPVWDCITMSERIFLKKRDPRVAPMTSVVAVEVAPDLKTCKAYISVLGDEKAQADTLKGLQSAEGYIRRELAHTLNMLCRF